MIECEKQWAKRPPVECADFLREAGGLNQYGGANILLVWGEHAGEDTGKGIVPPQNGLPCWNLCVWHPAEDAGPPSAWREDLGGRYPSEGFYEIVQPMYRTIDGKVDKIEALTPSIHILEAMVWNLKKHQYDSHEARQRAFRLHKERKEREQLDRIADVLQDSMPAFGGVESFSGVPNTVVRKRMEMIERQLRQRVALPHGPGIVKVR